jgi:CHAT domain-containing protein
MVGEETSWLWKLGAEKTRWWELPGRDELQNQVLRLLSALQGTETGQITASAHVRPASELARTLLPEGSLPEGARVVIVPDGILHYLPFEALLIGAGEDGQKPQYLIEKHVVSYSPSASALRLLRDRPTGANVGNRLLALGDPPVDNLPDSWDIPPLPFAHEEMMRIGQLFPEPDRALWVGPTAAEAVLKSEDLSGYRFIHFAATGWIHEEAPVQTSIFLGRDAEHRDDGLLRFNEIFQLRMDADLVVLSGSRTGFRAPVAGEGMVGLTRALMYSGARSVMVSLWNINDRSTAQLMESMYRALVRGDEPAVARRAAKLSLLRSGNPSLRHPSRWAPFVLNGDPGLRTAVADGSGSR